MDHCDSEIQSGKNGLDFLRLVLENCCLHLLRTVGRGALTPPTAGCRKTIVGLSQNDNVVLKQSYNYICKNLFASS